MLKKNKILFVGSLPNRHKSSIGGATMLFQNLIDYCDEKNYNYSLIVSNLFNFSLFAIPDILRVYVLGFFKLIACDVAMINVSGRGVYLVAPYFIFWGKLFNKKIVIRVFGGNLSETFDAAKATRKKILTWTIQNANALFVETKALVNYFQVHNTNTKWLPNARKPISGHHQKSSFSKRFIFLGQIKKSKGIDQLLATKKRLEADYTLHAYGPILEDEYASIKKGPVYKGVLIKEQVPDVLKDYDVLVLPTFWEGEGYPGVIIEAYALGLPCITTNWNAIPEIVEHGKTGMLISPKSVEELHEAILYFNEDNYPAMNEAAQQKFNEFNSNEVNAKLLRLLESL